MRPSWQTSHRKPMRRHLARTGAWLRAAFKRAITPRAPAMVIRVRVKLRRIIRKSWLLSRCYYRCRGARLLGRPTDEIWYFAYGANMHEATFRIRRGIQPLE